MKKMFPSFIGYMILLIAYTTLLYGATSLKDSIFLWIVILCLPPIIYISIAEIFGE